MNSIRFLSSIQDQYSHIERGCLEYGQSSIQPQEPGYGCMYKELGANVRGPEQEQELWFCWLLAAAGGRGGGW